MVSLSSIPEKSCLSRFCGEPRFPPELKSAFSHQAETYGPRLIQLGIALLRGNIVPPYNYVRHQAVTPESLTALQQN